MTRLEAELAEEKYYDGKVCHKHPELEGRRLLSGHCEECRRIQNYNRYHSNKEERREMARLYYARNRERAHEYYINKKIKEAIGDSHD